MAVVNPTVFYAESVRSALVARGIPIGGPAVDYDEVAAELMSGESGVDSSVACIGDRHHSIAAVARDWRGPDEGQPEPLR